MSLPIGDHELSALFKEAFPEGGSCTIQSRKAVHSFQQFLERVQVSFSQPVRGNRTCEFFVRLYHGYFSWWTLVTPDLPERELAAWQLARDAGVPVSQVYSVHETPHGKFAIMSCAPGEVLSSRAAQSAADPHFAVHLAGTLRQLHRAAIREESRRFLPLVRLPDFLERLRTWAAECDDGESLESLRVLSAEFAGVEEHPPVFIHGDCHLGNILTDDHVVTAVLDWEESAIGDPRFDIALLHTTLQQDAPTLADAFLQHYQDGLDFAVGDLQKWMDLARLRGRIVRAWAKRGVAEGWTFSHEIPRAWIP